MPPSTGAPGRRTYRIVTLGCKLNQFDSARVAGLLGGRAGAAPEGEPADLVLLNSCTVTHRADREARRLLRQLRRENPAATLAVMGCAARRDAPGYAAMTEVDEVLPRREEVDAFLARWGAVEGRGGCRTVPDFGGRTRAYLKVQEGCDLACSYCVVPSVRGPSRSVPPEEAAADLHALLEAGYREVVLTGINTGDWGRDLPGRGRLPDLVEALLAEPGDFRLRLNSVEPRRVTARLLEQVASSGGRLCRHLQVPLQSGSDAVLRAMKRNYRAGFYRKVLEEAAARAPGIGLGADVLVGFPTETPADFEATLRLVEASPLAFLHAFSFSPRPGTPAASLRPLPPVEVAARMRALRSLGRERAERFARSQEGRTLRALVLSGG